MAAESEFDATTTMAAPSRRKTSKKCDACGGKSGRHLPGCKHAGCEYCGMQVGHLPDCPEATPEERGEHTAQTSQCEAAIGEARCALEAGHNTGEQPTPHRAKGENGSELVWGYPDDEAFESEPGSDGAIKTTVDGAEATVVLNGSTGAPAQQELIATPIEDRIRAIGRKEEELDEARREKKRASDHVKALEEEHELMVRALVAQVDGVQTLPLTVDETDDAEEPEDAPLTGAERRALAMTDEDVKPEQERAREVETQPLSTQQPGLYVSEQEGPED